MILNMKRSLITSSPDLKSIGINHIFGVAGDYAFPVDDAIVNFQGIEYVGCCNELNAGYATHGLMVILLPTLT
jgi:TPP-dependent 2-oxoacid decarboxylase